MQVDLYLRWLLYTELFALFVVFIPFLSNIKRSVLLSISPLFSQIQYVFWVFWSFIGFIFVTTINEVYFVTPNTLDATAKLDLARNERDALMSFITLLLLPIIHLHGKSVIKSYKLQQSLTAMTKQATNASDYLKTLLTQESDDDKKKKKDVNTDTDTKMLREELELTKARLQKETKKSRDLTVELTQLKQLLTQYDTMQKVVKKKA